MEDKDTELDFMMNLIMESSKPMPIDVFNFYVSCPGVKSEKAIYNLIAESYLTLFSFCKLMFENAWSQAFALLRVGIEQIASVFVLATTPGSKEKFLELRSLQNRYICGNNDEKSKILDSFGVKKNGINNFFDYGWISSFTSDGKYGKDELLKLAKLDEFIVDIKETLNAFAHGSLSIFEMSGNNWDVLKRYKRRASLICCKLYDFLCCSYSKMVGKEIFSRLSIHDVFITFKQKFLSL